MLQIVYNNLTHTPIWVYAIFAYVLYVGIKATKDRVVSFNATFWIFPAIFIGFMVADLRDAPTNADLIYWLALAMVAWTIGLVIAFWSMRYYGITVIDLDKVEVCVPGSWLNLCLMLTFFAVKYFGYYTYRLHGIPTNLLLLLIALAAFCAGFFWGRLTYVYDQLRRERRKYESD